MVIKPQCAYLTLLALVMLAPSAEAQFRDHHPPYVDPHFDLHHTPLYDYGTQLTYSDYYDEARRRNASCGSASCGVCNGGVSGSNGNACNGNGNGGDGTARGSRSPKCPPVDTANLKLYVPDGAQVKINGYETKQQLLGGVHANSRIYLLEGLVPYADSRCEILVNGEPHTFLVRAGVSYKRRYPQDFRGIAGQPASGVISGTVVSEGGMMVPGEVINSAPTFNLPPGAPSVHEGPSTVVPEQIIQPAPQFELPPGAVEPIRTFEPQSGIQQGSF